MLLVLLEDDYVQADWIIPHLKQGITGVDILHIKTESAFRDYIVAQKHPIPNVFIVDEMLRWADRARIRDGQVVGETVPPPPDHDPQRAGVRVIEMLRYDERLSSVPIILYTVLEQLDLRYLGLPAHVTSVSKNTPPQELIATIATVAGAALSNGGR